MMLAGIIERSNSPWGFLILLVEKKDGCKRFCVDFRALNKITKKYARTLPVIDDILVSLESAKYFPCSQTHPLSSRNWCQLCYWAWRILLSRILMIFWYHHIQWTTIWNILIVFFKKGTEYLGFRVSEKRYSSILIKSLLLKLLPPSDKRELLYDLIQFDVLFESFFYIAY